MLAYVAEMGTLAWHQVSVGVDLEDVYMWFDVATNLHCLRSMDTLKGSITGNTTKP